MCQQAEPKSRLTGKIIPETAVGRARVGRCGRVWVGATTQQAIACKVEQRPRAWPQRRNRVRSAVTQKVNVVVAPKVSVHAAWPAYASGQLLFLGYCVN